MSTLLKNTQSTLRNHSEITQRKVMFDTYIYVPQSLVIRSFDVQSFYIRSFDYQSFFIRSFD